MVLRKLHARIACLLILLVAGHAPADESNIPLPQITVREALSLAEQKNPDLKAARSGLLSFDGRLQQASLKPAMEIAAEMENFLGSGDLTGVRSAEFTLALSQLIELGDKREQRKEVVGAQKDLVLSEIERQRLELASEVLVRFVRVAADQERFELARREQALAERTLAEVSDRVEAALAPEAERYRARAALEKAIAGTELAGFSQQRSLTWLAALWGETSPQFSGVDADLYHLPELVSFERLLTAVEQSPLALSQVKALELREAELALAESGSKRDLTLSGGVRRFQETDDNALVLSLSVPLQTARRNQGAISIAQADLDRAAADREATLATARAMLAARYQELLRVRVGITSLRERVLPQLKLALEGTEAAYRVGRYGYLELIDAQAKLIELQRDLIGQAERHHELLAEIEQLTGQSLVLDAAEVGEKE